VVRTAWSRSEWRSGAQRARAGAGRSSGRWQGDRGAGTHRVLVPVGVGARSQERRDLVRVSTVRRNVDLLVQLRLLARCARPTCSRIWRRRRPDQHLGLLHGGRTGSRLRRRRRAERHFVLHGAAAPSRALLPLCAAGLIVCGVLFAHGRRGARNRPLAAVVGGAALRHPVAVGAFSHARD
jgi:hypothetical protein